MKIDKTIVLTQLKEIQKGGIVFDGMDSCVGKADLLSRLENGESIKGTFVNLKADVFNVCNRITDDQFKIDISPYHDEDVKQRILTESAPGWNTRCLNIKDIKNVSAIVTGNTDQLSCEYKNIVDAVDNIQKHGACFKELRFVTSTSFFDKVVKISLPTTQGDRSGVAMLLVDKNHISDTATHDRLEVVVKGQEIPVKSMERLEEISRNLPYTHQDEAEIHEGTESPRWCDPALILANMMIGIEKGRTKSAHI